MARKKPDVIKQKELEEAWKTTEEGQQFQAEIDRCVKQQDEYFKASMGLDGLNPANVVDCIARHKMTWPQCIRRAGILAHADVVWNRDRKSRVHRD